MIEEYQFLIDEAELALEHAYCPYSKFAVGSALLAKNQAVFTGCNIENSSYSLTMCAERVAIYKAVSEGVFDFDAIAIFHDGDEMPYPCGACLQVLAEFNEDLIVIIASHKQEKSFTVKELLPCRFNLD